MIFSRATAAVLNEIDNDWSPRATTTLVGAEGTLSGRPATASETTPAPITLIARIFTS